MIWDDQDVFTSVEKRRSTMKARPALALTMLSLIAAAGVIASPSPAQAEVHWTAGSYQVFVGGQQSGTWRLSRGGGVAPYDAAHWSIQKRTDVVTVTSYGPALPPETCFQYVHAYGCQSNVAFTGRKTSDGIASHGAPGLYTVSYNQNLWMRQLRTFLFDLSDLSKRTLAVQRREEGTPNAERYMFTRALTRSCRPSWTNWSPRGRGKCSPSPWKPRSRHTLEPDR